MGFNLLQSKSNLNLTKIQNQLCAKCHLHINTVNHTCCPNCPHSHTRCPNCPHPQSHRHILSLQFPFHAKLFFPLHLHLQWHKMCGYTHRWWPDENSKYPKRTHLLDHQDICQYCRCNVNGNMTNNRMHHVYTNKKYSLVVLVDSNEVISILSLFLTELDTVYPEQLLTVYQLDFQKNLLKSLL